MKKMLFAVVMLAAACGLCGCNDEPQVTQMVSVDVKTATMIHHDGGNRTETINYVYDERGNLLSDKSDWDGESSWWENTYDRDDNLRISTMYALKGKAVERIVYAYDEDGMNSCVNVFMKYDTGWAWDSTTWLDYDENGNMIVVDVDDRYDGYHYRYENVYDSDGNLLRSWCADANGELLTIDEFDYEDGVGVGGRNLTGNGEVLSEWVTTRDADGNAVKRESETERAVYTYDKDGNCLSEANYTLEDGRWRLNDRTESTYDAAGRLVTGISYFGNGEVLGGSAYTYDEQGRILTMAGIEENGTWRTVYENIYGQIDVLADSVDNALAQQEDM